MSDCKHDYVAEDGCCLECGKDILQDRIAELEAEVKAWQHSNGLYIEETNEIISELEAELARLREAAQDFLNSTREAGPEGWRNRATKHLEKLLEAGDETK